MNNKKFLDELGKTLVEKNYNSILNGKKKLLYSDKRFDRYKEFYKIIDKLTYEEKKIIFNIFKDDSSTWLFSLMVFFEENNQFKIMYDTGEELIDLKVVSHTEGNAGFLNGEVLDWIDDYGDIL